LALGLSGTAAAQTPSTATTQPTTYGQTVSHWVASGFVGGGFNGNNNDNPRVDENAGGVTFGGQVGYLWKGIVGPEFLFEWAPSFDVTSVLIPTDSNTHVLSYMANAIGALPLGADGQVMPYISGGFGAIQMAADVVNPFDNSVSNNQNTEWGTNLGGGIMAFASNRWGVRGDVRYYHANTDNNFNGSAQDQFVQSLVSGLSYWRATGGVSVRW
jgi:outer membrane protein with beta-barrel domain